MATFSVTDLANFRRCRTKWNWSSNARMNLTRVGANDDALELGGIVHRALAQWILTPDANLGEIYIAQANARMDELTLSYKERTGDDIPDEIIAPILDTLKLGTAMMVNYQKMWKSPVPNNMKFAAAEQEIRIPVPGTEHQCENCLGTGIDLEDNDSDSCPKCVGTGVEFHYLSGTLDGLLQDANGWLYVLEHKTYSQRPSLIDLRMNDQFTGYAWMVSKLGIGKVRGIAYDGMWKRAEVPKSKGTTFDDLFIRTTIVKSAAALAQWEINLTKTINEMANDPEIYPNVPWQGCWDCGQFRDMCQMQLEGEDISGVIAKNYMQREVIRVQGIRETDVS